jgi:hypothetical protein
MRTAAWILNGIWLKLLHIVSKADMSGGCHAARGWNLLRGLQGAALPVGAAAHGMHAGEVEGRGGHAALRAAAGAPHVGCGRACHGGSCSGEVAVASTRGDSTRSTPCPPPPGSRHHSYHAFWPINCTGQLLAAGHS